MNVNLIQLRLAEEGAWRELFVTRGMAVMAPDLLSFGLRVISASVPGVESPPSMPPSLPRLRRVPSGRR